METPRFPISWLMFLVVFVAVDVAGARTLLEVPTWTSRLLVFGGLPMANILAAGLILARRPPRSQAFFRGFQIAGSAALLLFVLGAVAFPEVLQEGCGRVARLFLEPLGPWLFLSPLGDVIAIPFLVLMLVGPQFAAAVLGGLVSQRCGNAGREDPVEADAASLPIGSSAPRST